MRLLLLLLLFGSSMEANAQNLISGRRPSSAPSIFAPERLTDGESPVDGDPWDGPAASLIPPGSRVEWDLGATQPLHGAALQADNNDDYILSLSEDGANWREAWRARAVEGGGLRTRSIKTPLGNARFIRLEADGGDGRYSVSELEVFAESTGDSTVLRAKWIPRRPLEQAFVVWILGAAGLLMLASRRQPFIVQLGLAAIGVVATAYLVFELVPRTPGALSSLPWIRASVALVAAAAVLRDRLWPTRWPAPHSFLTGTLGVTGAMGLWCFLNLGTPQFHDVGAGRGTWLHHYDMRTYYPIAKYFPELRFDGVYAASLLAVADGRSLELFDEQPLRDLRTHALTTVQASKTHLQEVRSRFTPERWALFLSDMVYFRRAMGDGGFLGSMNDHGGNATPVWFLSARALFSSAPASDATLWSGVIADIALALLAFLALGWAFGTRTALLAMTVFGAMDFYQFGSNWFGATLRHDWLSLWAIGLCLLRKQKFTLAGIAFAWSAWIRAFPAVTFITLSLPVVWLGGKFLLQRRGGQAWTVLKPLLRVALGVAIASLVLVGLSCFFFGVEAWGEWLRKVQTLDRDNHLNNIAFRTYVAGDKTVWAATCAGTLAMLLWVLRRASMARAAAWGVALIPLIFNPANYYLHSAFLLVTLAGERRTNGEANVGGRGVLVWIALLAMCVGSYFTNLSMDLAEHFRLETIVLFGTLAVLWLLELGRAPEAEEALSPSGQLLQT